MINHVYQLIAPGMIRAEFEDISISDKVIIRPEYMALCHADQRYYRGQRDAAALREKLPMALVHECCGRVAWDPTGHFKPGQSVVLIPNIPAEKQLPDLYENYSQGAGFLSSGQNGFMQELVAIAADRVIPCEGIPGPVAAVTEFVSVAVHAFTRFHRAAHMHRKTVAVWGDGSLAYVMANVLRMRLPDSRIVVVGRHRQKLTQFSFAHETYMDGEIPEDMQVDHAFECCGGSGSADAVQQIICHIRPQGTVMLMGVSETPVPVATRLVLEKGLTLVGCSRSGREDFLEAVQLMQQKAFQNRLKVILYEDAPVRTISDIHRVFRSDLTMPFKTVFRWEG